MRAAIEVAEANQTPFGVALAMGNELFVTAANQAKTLNDPTTHAEVVAIRKLGEMTGKTTLSGFTLYTTCEPCPLCMSAIIQSKIDTLFYGFDSQTVAFYTEQIHQQARNINQTNLYGIKMSGNILNKECETLFKAFG